MAAKFKKTQNKNFTSAQIESYVHDKLKEEAMRNNISLSDQIQSIMDHNIKLQEHVDELRERINKIQDVN